MSDAGGPREPRPLRVGEARPLRVGEALLPIAAMLALFAAGAATLGVSAELLIAVLLGAAAVAGFVAARHGHGWDEIQRSTGAKLAEVLPALLILLSIGMLIATWVFSGTIPYLVYWGIRLVRPQYLVLTAFLATATMSLFTGTSWGSAGTVGVALMGTAAALHAPLGVTAGAIVSGAYFGDKMSPLSDSTNISAIAADVPLYRHIRHMLYTAVPSFALSLAVYTLVAHGAGGEGAAQLGAGASGAAQLSAAAGAGAATAGAASSAVPGLPESARVLLRDIRSVYHLSWIVLLPPAIVVWSIVRRVPPALAIAASSLVAAVIGVVLQSFAVHDALLAAVAGFRVDMVRGAGVDPGALGVAFHTLTERGGLYEMANTFVVILAAFLLAGGMDVSGALDLLIDRMLGAVRSVFGLIGATMASGATMIALTSHGGVTALVVGGLFQRAYRERGLAPENLSRSLEDSVTITEPLMPWTVSAMFMATTLGVPTVRYAPWAVFCYGGPIFSLLIAATWRWTGYGIRTLAGARSGAEADGSAAGGGRGLKRGRGRART